MVTTSLDSMANSSSVFINGSRNGSMVIAAEENWQLPTTSKNVLYVIYFVTFVVGTTTNASVIYIIGIKQRFVKRFDIYIVSLATADLMASVLIPCMTIHNLVTNDWQLLGKGGCKFFTSIKPYTKLVSAMMLIAISIGRLRVIKSNVPIPQIRRRTVVEALSVWILSALITVPRAFYFTLTKGHCHDPDFQSRNGYYVLMEILICFLPVVAMVVIYTASGCFIMNKNIPNSGNCKLWTQRRNQYKKMTRMFGLLVIVFVTFTAPYSIVMFVIYYKKHSPDEIIRNDRVLLYLQHAFKVLLSIHYCINPYIYAKMHHSFGKHIKHMKETWYRWKFRLSKDDDRSEQKRQSTLLAPTLTELEERSNTTNSPEGCTMQTSSLTLDVEKLPVRRMVSDNSVSSFTMF